MMTQHYLCRKGSDQYMKPKIKEVIVVEGKDDVSALRRAVEADILITTGLGANADKNRRNPPAGAKTRRDCIYRSRFSGQEKSGTF